MAYLLNEVAQIDPSFSFVLDGPTGSDMGFPATFDKFLFSIWYCRGGGAAPFSISFGGPDPAELLYINTSSAGVTIRFGERNGTDEIFTGFFATSISRTFDTEVNVIVSVDTTAQLIQVCMNDEILTPDPSNAWVSNDPIQNIQPADAGGWEWFINPGEFGNDLAPVANLWVDNPAAYFDLLNVTNRRKFINADFTPADVGSNGQNVTGIIPKIFLRRNALPADFPINKGSGGVDFTLEAFQTMIIAPPTCMFQPIPPSDALPYVLPKYYIGEVVQLQCSPCADFQFPFTPPKQLAHGWAAPGPGGSLLPTVIFPNVDPGKNGGNF